MEIVLPLGAGLAAGIIAYLLVVKTRTRFTSPSGNGWRAKIIDRAALVVILLALLVYLFLDWERFRAFGVWGFDFALFDQVVWNTVHGRILENTLKADAPILLAERFSPILFAFVPLYAVLDGSLVLIAAPAVAITLAAVPLYWIARRRVGRELAFLVALSFLLAPGVQNLAIGQFYEIILTIPFLMLATYFVLERRYVPFYISLGLAMMCKEEVGFIAAAFGVYIFIAHRHYRLGGMLAGFGMAWVIFLIQVVIPHFQGNSTYYYFGGSITHGSDSYSYLGNSISEIASNALTHPDVVVKNVLVKEKIDAVIQILTPVFPFVLAGLDLASLALPTLGYTLLSNREGQYMPGSYHYSPVYVFIFVGLVIGIERLFRWSSALAHRAKASFDVRIVIGSFILVSSLSNYYLNASGPLARNYNSDLYNPSPHDDLGARLAQAIPPDAIVLAQSELTSRLAHRRSLFADVGYPCLSGLDYVFSDQRRTWYWNREGHWEETENLGWFETISNQDGYFLGKRAAVLPLEKELNLRFGDAFDLIGYTVPLTDTAMGGRGVRLLTAWRAARSIQDRHVFDVTIEDLNGHVWATSAYEPCKGTRPTTAWIPGQINYDDRVLNLPVTMPSGKYRVLISVFKRGNDAALLAEDSVGANLEEVEITTLAVNKNKNSFTANDLLIEERLFADMGEMRLLGFKPIPFEIKAGDSLPIGLYWRARGKPQGDYLFVVQLRDGNGNLILQDSARPAQDTYPTTQWNLGEVLLDWHDLTLPKPLGRGKVRLIVMVIDSQSGRILGETNLRELEIVE